MPIIRTDHKERGNFTQISNRLLNDSNISYGARGLLVSALSNSDNWNFYGEECFVTINDKISKIKGYIKELINHGYLTRYQEKNDKGNFGKMVYIFRETPILDKPHSELVSAENKITKETSENANEQTIVTSPVTDPLLSGKQPFNNTNKNNNSININKKTIIIENVIDSYSQNKDIKNCILEFLKMRESIRRPMTERALILFLDNLNQLSSNDNEKIQILNNSIMNAWLNIYPLREKNEKDGIKHGEHREFVEQSNDPLFARSKF